MIALYQFAKIQKQAKKYAQMIKNRKIFNNIFHQQPDQIKTTKRKVEKQFLSTCMRKTTKSRVKTNLPWKFQCLLIHDLFL